jgi:hypothetical protein
MRHPFLITLAVIAANLLLVLLFPPHDYVSLQRGNVPTFDGFYFAFGNLPNRVINRSFLTLEILVLGINACIAWLLLHKRTLGKPAPGGNPYQRGVLWVIAANLLLVVLFPPFQNYVAITKAVLPSFEGFYFVFGDNAQRQLVTSILYIEVALVVINGGLLWLFLKDRGREKLDADDIRRLAQQLQATRREKA